MNYWVPFIGYSAFFLSDDNRVHAGYDFVGESLTIFFDDGDNEWSDCRFVLEGKNLADLDIDKVQLAKFVGQNDMKMVGDSPMVLKPLRDRFRELRFILPKALDFGRKITRAPFRDYTIDVSKKGFAKIVVHGVGLLEDSDFVVYPIAFEHVLATPDGQEYDLVFNISEKEFLRTRPRLGSIPKTNASELIVQAEHIVQGVLAGDNRHFSFSVVRDSK
jgi:hypothetical protein